MRALAATLALLVAAPAIAQPVTPIPTRTPRGARGTRHAAPASGGGGGGSYVQGESFEAQPTTTHQEGDYGGVTPGEAPKPARPDHPRPKRKPSKGTLSWVGFEAKGGGAEVFFQSVAPFDVTQHVEGGALVVHLAGLSTLGANAWRPVDTRFFDNPLARIEARRVGAAGATKSSPAHGAGIDVRITFKNPVDVHEGATHAGAEADGYYYAYLSFPEGAGARGAGSASMAQPEQ